MIAMQNIIDSDKTLMSILFDRSVLNHLKCKCDDYIVVLQSNFNSSYFMIAKADTGYRVRRYPAKKKIYQVNIGFQFKYIPEFDLVDCSYFLRKNNSIRIILRI